MPERPSPPEVLIRQIKAAPFFAKTGTYLVSVGEEAFELLMSLLAMVLVERCYGPAGLGIYAYMTACMFTARYLANLGVAQYTAREVAALTGHPQRQQAVVSTGYQTLVFTGFIVSAVLLVTAYFDAGLTRVGERAGGYLIIAVAVPVANLNFLRFAALHGMGFHGRVARLRMVRFAILLGSLGLLCRVGVAPSFLLLGFLVPDVVMARFLRPHLPSPALKGLLKGRRQVRRTLKTSQAYMFGDNGMALLLNIDFFVLGLFVTSWDLGVYAEAAVLIRFFLILPAALKPIFKARYATLAAQGRGGDLVAAARRGTVALFSLQCVLALWVLSYFPLVLDLFFKTRGETLLSYRIFAMVIPGLIFYGALSSQESLLEAVGGAERLEVMVIAVALVNLLLTFFLVPMAGIKGAATATMLTMLMYFGLFGNDLPRRFRIRKYHYITAGLAVYLVHMLLGRWGAPGLDFWLGPILLGVLFYLSGLYGTSGQRTAHGRRLNPEDANLSLSKKGVLENGGSIR